MTQPFLSPPMNIEKEWLDYNGHMNMAYYNVLFDRAAEGVFDHLGLGADYARTRKLTIYTAEIHVCYVQELHLGHQVRGSFQIIDSDAKRIHAYQELLHVDGWLAATCETMSLHVDMEGPKVASFPPDIMERLNEVKAEQADLPMPSRVGRSIGFRKK